MSELWNLRQLNLFSDVKPQTMEQVLRVVTVRQFKRGEYIFRPGDTCNKLYLLHHGRIKTYVLSDRGQEKIMHIFHPGDAFGDLLFGAPHGELPWAQAMDDVVISCMGEVEFKQFIQNFPDLCMNIFRYIAAHHAGDMRRMEHLIHTDASHRLVFIMLELADKLGLSEAEIFELTTYTHEDLANMIGVVRSTVSDLISQLRVAGVCSGSGRRLVVNRRAAKLFLQADDS